MAQEKNQFYLRCLYRVNRPSQGQVLLDWGQDILVAFGAPVRTAYCHVCKHWRQNFGLSVFEMAEIGLNSQCRQLENRSENDSRNHKKMP